MSLNTAHVVGGQGILIYNGEMILLYVKKVQMTFDKAVVAPMKGAKRGELFLTSHRIIFRSLDNNDHLQSFCMPFHSLRNVTLEQPILGANYLRGECVAQPNGNFEGSAAWRLTFDKGGCIDFGKALLKATDLAARARPQHAPPPYAPPPGGYFSPPPAYYTPGDRTYHGFQPPVNVFPDQPPETGVFMYEAPPPYYGIGGDAAMGTNAPPYPANGPPTNAATAAAAKEEEARASAANANAPPPPNDGGNLPPPTYDEATGGLRNRRP